MGGLLIDALIYLANHESRSSSYFLVDAADILTDDTESHDADAYQKVEDRKERKHTLRLGPDHQPPDEQVNHEKDGKHRYDHADESENLKRHHGKARHKIEIQADQIIKTIF